MTAFLVIGGIGVVLLLVSLVLGDLLEGVFGGLGGDLLSGAALSGFVGAFGFTAALAYDASGSTGIAVVAGIVGGVLIGALAGWLSLKLREGGDESTVRTSELTGRVATVTNDVPVDGYGEVSLVVAGHRTKLNAKSVAPLPMGTSVTITDVLSPTAVMVAYRYPEPPPEELR
jgi:membrane protein implicated in regulation of membrane protease activity